MPVDVLRCRDLRERLSGRSQTVSAPAASGRSSRSTTGTRSPSSPRASGSRPGRGRSGATARCCPPSRRRTARAGRAGRRSCPAPRLASAVGVGEVFLKLDLSNPTHSFKDRVVAVAAAKAREFGLETLSATSTGNLANAVAARAAATRDPRGDLLPGRARAREVRRRRRSTAPRSTASAARYDDCSRLVSELAGEVDWGIVNVNLRSYYAEGSKTLAFEISEQLGWETPDAVVMPIGSGAMFTKVWQGFKQFRAARARSAGSSRSSTAGRRRAATRSRPRSPRTGASRRCGRNSVVVVDRDRQPGRRRPRRSRSRGASGGGDLRRARGRGRREHLAARRDGAASSARARRASRSARCARPSRRGELGESDRVVVLVTGTGLKTPQRQSESSGPDRRDRRPTSTRCSKSWE